MLLRTGRRREHPNPRRKTSPSPSWRLNCTRFIGCPPLAEHVLALSAYPTTCTGGHRYIVVQIESDQTGFPGSLVAYALS